MMHQAVPREISLLHLDRPRLATTILRLMVLVGAGTFFHTLFSDPALAWKSYVTNWSFFTSIALGGTLVAVATWIVKAKWNWPLRRIHQSYAAYLPIAFVLFIPMLFSLREDYFPWIEMMEYDPIVQKKAAWLNIPFLLARNLVGVVVLFSMAIGFVYLALRPDMGRIHQARTAAERADRSSAWWRARISRGWTGQEAEEERSYQLMTKLAPAYVLVYAAVMTMLVFDWSMSLEPHWFSTLYGGWYFMGAFWGGFAATAVSAILVRRHDRVFRGYFGPKVRWDLGKLVFAFAVFWTYLFWSQYIVIWYGKLPWEQAWVATRLGEPWGGFSLAVIVLCFVVPFFGLLGVRPKRNPAVLGAIATAVLCGIWLWHYMLFFPSLHHEGDPVFSVRTPLIGLMFLGLFGIAVRWFLATFPLVQMWQPPVDPEPAEAEGR